MITGVLNKPILLGNVPSEMSDLGALAKLGVRICLQGHKPHAAGVQAVYDTLKALREGTPASNVQGAQPELMKRLTRADDYDAWTRDYLDDG